MYYYKFVYAKSNNLSPGSDYNQIKILNENLTYIEASGSYITNMQAAVEGTGYGQWVLNSSFTFSSEKLIKEFNMSIIDYCVSLIHGRPSGGHVTDMDVYICNNKIGINDNGWKKIGVLKFNITNDETTDNLLNLDVLLDCAYYFIKDTYGNVYATNTEDGTLTVLSLDQISDKNIVFSKGIGGVTLLFDEYIIGTDEDGNDITFIPFNLIKQELGNKQFNVLRCEFS